MPQNPRFLYQQCYQAAVLSHIHFKAKQLYALRCSQNCCSWIHSSHFSVLFTQTPIPSSVFFLFFQRFPALTFFSFSPPSGLSFCLPAKHLFLSVLQPSGMWITSASSLHITLMPAEKTPRIQNRLSLHAQCWDLQLTEPTSEKSN